MRAGQRSKEYTRLFSCSAFASSVGPAIAIGVFLATGNAWTEHALQVRSDFLVSVTLTALVYDSQGVVMCQCIFCCASGDSLPARGA